MSAEHKSSMYSNRITLCMQLSRHFDYRRLYSIGDCSPVQAKTYLRDRLGTNQRMVMLLCQRLRIG